MATLHRGEPLAAPTISIAMCTYNGEKFVRGQLESIAGQTMPATQVVISDDGSTDGTVQAIREFIAAYSGPTTFTLAHTARAGGVRVNFARAIGACSGDLIALCDQDDVWRPDRLQVAVDALAARPELLAVHADARIVDAAGTPTGASLLESLYVSDAEKTAIHKGRAIHVLMRRNLATGATMMFRSALLEHALPLSDNWVHDEWLAVMAAATGGLDLIEDELIDYRIHGGNAIGVVQPTLRNRLGQLRVPRGDRYTRLTARAEELVTRLTAIDADMDLRRLAVTKAEFERDRAAYPAERWRRIVPVLRRVRRGGYPTLSSQGRADIVRDLVQPA